MIRKWLVSLTILLPVLGYLLGSRIVVPVASQGISLQCVAPTISELESLGLLPVTKFGADPTCAKDSTVAIQQAMDQAYQNDLVTFFPTGEYCISNTLYGKKFVTSNSQYRNKGYELIGSTMGARPIIKLKANSPGFNNSITPKPVVLIHSIDASNGLVMDANGFMQGVRNLDIEVEAGNAGAIGLELTGAQDNVVHNVTVKLTSGYAGFGGFVGDNSAISNIEVRGGKYGITKSTKGSYRWPVITNARFFDQSDAALHSLDSTQFMFAGLYIRKAKGPALITNGSSGTAGNITILDGKIEFTQLSSEPAIQNDGGKAIALLNTYFYNTQNIISNPNSTLASDGSGWRKVNEYANPGGGVNVINGTIQTSAYPGTVSSENPPTDILLKHAANPADYPSPDMILARVKAGDSSVAVATHHGINPTGTMVWDPSVSTPDVSTPLQNLINTGVSTILFPKGVYLISRTIELKENTHLMGISNQSTGIVMTDNWKPSATNPATMIRTPDSKTASPKLSFFRVLFKTSPTSLDYQNGLIHIRSGKTVFFDTFIDPIWSGDTTDNHPNIRFWFTGNAGGKYYGMTLSAGEQRNQHPGYRHALIEGTTNPLVMYGANPEDHNFHGQTDGWGVEVKNAKNVAFIGTKQENHNTIKFVNSDNIVATALANHDNDSFINSSNYLGSMYPKFFTAEVQYLETFGGQTISVQSNKNIGLFKRGSINHEALFTSWPFSESSGCAPQPSSNPSPTLTQNPTPTQIPTTTPSWDLNNDGDIDVFDFGHLIKGFGETFDYQDLQDFLTAFVDIQ